MSCIYIKVNQFQSRLHWPVSRRSRDMVVTEKKQKPTNTPPTHTHTQQYKLDISGCDVCYELTPFRFKGKKWVEYLTNQYGECIAVKWAYKPPPQPRHHIPGYSLCLFIKL